MKCVVLTGGGTAGHCTPNIALIPHLKNYFDKIIYVGSYEGIEKDLAVKNNLEYFLYFSINKPNIYVNIIDAIITVT